MAGGAVALSGVGLLGFQHMDLWFNLDFAGSLMIGVGAAVCASSQPNLLGGKQEKQAERQFDFVMMNDQVRLEADLLQHQTVTLNPNLNPNPDCRPI